MFKGLGKKKLSWDKQQKQTATIWIRYEREKEGIKFSFISDMRMAEEQLQMAMEIICGDLSKGREKDQTTCTVFRKCFPGRESGAVDLRPCKKSNVWEVIIGKYPMDFR